MAIAAAPAALDTDCGPLDRRVSGLCRADDRPRPACAANTDCRGGQMCVNGACRSACRTPAHCCLCGDAIDSALGGFCVTPGEADPVCRAASECTGTQSCIDAVGK